MNRTERLLDLITYLLNAKDVVSWKKIKNHFSEDYGNGIEESNQRKFERDKAELISLGIPIDYQSSPDGSKEGYLIRRDELFLPELEFTPREFSLLMLAAEAVRQTEAFPYREQLESALNKIVSLHPRVDDPPEEFAISYSQDVPGAHQAAFINRIQDALDRRKSIEIRYHSFSKRETTDRRVNPYGLIFRRGRWTLVGWDHLRQDIRSFVVNRIQRLDVNLKKPGSPDFQVPEDFSLQQYKNLQAWEWRSHPPIQVVIRVSAHRLNELLPQLSGATRLGEHDFAISVTNREGLLSWVLWQKTDVRILSPIELKREVRQALRKLA